MDHHFCMSGDSGVAQLIAVDHLASPNSVNQYQPLKTHNKFTNVTMGTFTSFYGNGNLGFSPPHSK